MAMIKIKSADEARAVAEWLTGEVKLTEGDRNFLTNPLLDKRVTEQQRNLIGLIASRALDEADVDFGEFWVQVREIRERLKKKADAKLKKPTEPLPDKPDKPAHKPGGLVDQRNWLLADIANDKRLTRGHILVLDCLYKHSWPGRDHIDLKLERFVEETKLHKTTICRNLNDLEKWGYFKRQCRHDGKWEDRQPKYYYGGRNQHTRYCELLSRAAKRHSPDTETEPGANPENETVARGATVKTETVARGATVKREKLSPVELQFSAPSSTDLPDDRAHEGRARGARGLPDFRPGKEVGEQEESEPLPTSSEAKHRNRYHDSADYESSLPTEISIGNAVPRRRGDPSEWVPFFQRFYFDGGYDLAELHPDECDERFCYEILANEFRMDPRACDVSIYRFKQWVAQRSFPGEEAALYDLRRWLFEEKRKEVHPDRHYDD